jgi:hypothetical protein
MATLHYRRQSGVWHSLDNQPNINSPNKIYMGASVGYETMASLEAKAGATMDLTRCFDPGFNTNFASTTGAGPDVGLRGTIYSFKPDMALIAAGDTATMADLNTLLDSIPAGHNTWICAWHEPEDNFITPSERDAYRDGWAVFAAAVHAKNRPELKTIWIMSSSAWRIGGTNYFYTDYIPTNFATSVDVIGLDDYNGGSLRQPQRWDSPGMGLGRPFSSESLQPFGGGFIYDEGSLGYARDNDKPVIICEWGSIVNHNAPTPQWCLDVGIPSSRAAWLEYGVDWMALQPEIIGLCYFNSHGRTWAGNSAESWEFYNTPAELDYQAWGRATLAHAKGGLV